MREELLFLSERDVQTLLSFADAITTAEDTFRQIGLGNITVGTNTCMHVSLAKNNAFHAMPAILHHKHIAGMKWISTYNAPLPGYPFTHGNLVVLSDTGNGSPIALVGATHITTLRTAGGHAVVQAKYLCNPEPQVLTVIGCGTQARAGIEGFLIQFPTLKQIRIFGRSPAPMKKVKEDLRGRACVVLCDSAEQALSGSQLVLVASGAPAPLLDEKLLRPGMTIVGLTAFRDMAPQIALRADKWFVGYRKSDEHILSSTELNPGRLLSARHVHADLPELLTGQAEGRAREDEIIVSTHMGMGAHDVNCAAIVYARACRQGVGQRLLLDI